MLTSSSPHRRGRPLRTRTQGLHRQGEAGHHDGFRGGHDACSPWLWARMRDRVDGRRLPANPLDGYALRALVAELNS